jgi:hypothetical protein
LAIREALGIVQKELFPPPAPKETKKKDKKDVKDKT